jgi:cyclase
LLKVRVIPTLLWKQVGLVKGVAFDSWRRVGSVLPAVKVYNLREVDELVVLDIAATHEQRMVDLDMVCEIASECFVPLTVGGGISSVEHVREVLRAGADKVAINSAAYRSPDLIRQAAQRFGAQCVVVSIDAKEVAPGRYECFSDSGTVSTKITPAEMAARVEALGAGELLVTSIERDGTMKGYDLELIRSVAGAVSIPVIASGGAGSYEDFTQAVRSGASGVAAASIYHFTQQTPLEAKQYMARHGIAVRNLNARLQPESR